MIKNDTFKYKTIIQKYTMQKTGLSRNTIDKYYTNNATVKLCMNTFKKHVIMHYSQLKLILNEISRYSN